MRRSIFAASLITLALLCQPRAEAAAACGADVRAGATRVTVASGGKSHGVSVFLPATVTAGQRVPLILGLHPSGGSGASFDADTGLSSAAIAKGFAVALPDGAIDAPPSNGAAVHYWNIPGVPLVNGDAVPAGTRDDVRFVSDVIEQLVKSSCVDPRRVYVTGFSGGARMSSMVGCRLADRVAAIAPVAGLRAGRAAAVEFTQPDADDCKPARPVSVLGIHGTGDETNPYPGGGGVRWGYSVQRAAQRWAALDACGATPAVAGSSSHSKKTTYAGCRGNSEVVLMTIEAPGAQGGGHVWPGGKRDLASRTQQGVEVDATQSVLEFFARH